MQEIIAATGHRPSKLGGYGGATEARLAGFAVAYLRQARPSKTISGMAQGWDFAFARASLELGIPFIAAVPFDGQEALWPAETQIAYRDLLTRAATVHIVSPGGYSAAKMRLRNEWMVDNGTRLAALWDGSTGGTASCVRYAEQVGLPLENLWSRWQAYKELRLRLTVIGGETAPNDFVVMREGRSIGRLREATERYGHNPGWDWTINIPLPVPAWTHGSAASLEEAKLAFKEAWGRFFATLTPDDIAHWHETVDAAQSRSGAR